MNFELLINQLIRQLPYRFSSYNLVHTAISWKFVSSLLLEPNEFVTLTFYYWINSIYKKEITKVEKKKIKLENINKLTNKTDKP